MHTAIIILWCIMIRVGMLEDVMSQILQMGKVILFEGMKQHGNI